MLGVNEDRVKLWIEALRSGEFTQAKGWMETRVDKGDVTVTGNCCLGVATHVALRNGYEPPDGLDPSGNDLDWGQTAMHTTVGAWYGFPRLDSSDPVLMSHVDDEGMEDSIYATGANDELGWTFDQIADALEARYITPDTSKESQVSG